MQRVIVTVKREDETRARDLEVPADIDSIQLANLVAEALRWQGAATAGKPSYTIEAYPLGRTIEPRETLAAAGVWDGSWLIFHPIRSTQQAVQPTIISTPQAQVVAPVYPTLVERVTSAPPPTYTPTPVANVAEPPGPAIGNTAPVVQPPPPTKTVTGWRSLGLDLPTPASVQEAPPPPPPVSPPAPSMLNQAPEPEPQPPAIIKKSSSSFVWKQLDD